MRHSGVTEQLDEGGTVPCVHELFEQQVRLAPQAVAAVCGGREATYAELNAMANRLARRLVESGVGTGERVAIVMNRGLACLTALIAALKCGAVYVPVDIALPDRRIDYILRDSGARHVLADEQGERRLDMLAGDFHLLRADLAEDGEAGDLGLLVDPGQAVYCIYTSGSTGMPKGVLVRHGGLSNYVAWARDRYCAPGIGSFAFYSSLSFDLTVTSIFVPLVAGLTVRIYPEREGDTPALLDVLDDNAVDLIKLTPSHLMLLRDADLAGSRLRTLIVGGEDLKAGLAREISDKLGGRAVLYNEYGPTETVVGCMIHRFDPAVDTTGSVPIGGPIDRTRIHLLNEDRQPVPRGAVGEIHVGGAGVAIGYLNQPELTRERFVDDPFMPGAKLYATGDLGREDAAGRLTFLGRTDSQIKLSGYRVELGEIENTVLRHPAVQECVVTTTAALHAAYSSEGLRYCVRCGMASSFPGTTFSADGMCNHCAAYDEYKGVVDGYFSGMDELAGIVAEIKSEATGPYDCLVALSGGKDSTYALCRVVDLGLRVLAYTLDNGFISETAKANIARVVERLGIDHRYVGTPHMNAIFVDSINRHSNVCNGCFKTIYTLGINLAQEVGVDTIVLGLSKGQLFETRISELFRAKTFEADVFEKNLVQARKIYHRIDDAPRRLLDTSCVMDDAVLEKVRFVDFYRYCHVSREEMYRYIERRVGWFRPEDTGRSTNCLLNDVGIYVHKRQRGYHNYSLPYSWDVRVGHIPRSEAMREIEDTDLIDEEKVLTLLDELGYDIDQQDGHQVDTPLVAYYVSAEDIDATQLKAFAAAELAEYMVPRFFMRLDQMPLTPNGKVNHRGLPRPNPAERLDEALVEPRNALEEDIAAIWRKTLMVEAVGVHQNFFEAGGHSLTALMLLYTISQTFGQTISIQAFSIEPTIDALSRRLAETRADAVDN